MSVCTFFGHRECYGLDVDRLYREIERLIELGVDTFYVGDRGQFDGCVRTALRQLQAKYPHICYAVVLAALPVGEPREDTMYPEGLENTPPIIE